MFRKLILLGGLGVAVTTLALVGCYNAEPVEKPAAPPPGGDPKGATDQVHGHKPGGHGGILVALGKDSYHAEAVFAKNGVIRLYTLGKDEARIQEVEVEELVGFATAAGSTDAAVEVKFVAEPQKGDAAGKTSLFVAKLPADLQGKSIQVTINNIRVGSERFRIAFSNETVAHDGTEMPAKKASDDERELFLTPGGIYTAADIKANGGAVPTEKYKGIRPAHDDNPKVGQKICPISKTLANPKFTWMVGGKTYEFCCIPCIEEFVAKSKEKPVEILDPSAYIKK